MDTDVKTSKQNRMIRRLSIAMIQVVLPLAKVSERNICLVVKFKTLKIQKNFLLKSLRQFCSIPCHLETRVSPVQLLVKNGRKPMKENKLYQ